MNEDHIPEPPTHIESIAHAYTKRLWWPILLAILFEILLLTRTQTTEYSLLTFGAHAIIVLLVIIHGLQLSARWQDVAVTSGMVGAVMAAVESVVLLFTQFHITLVFRLFTNTIFTGVIDGIAGGLFYILVMACVQLYRKQRKLKNKKAETEQLEHKTE